MALRIITADERLAEPRSVKAAIVGKPGSGKTWLLNTTCPITTLFVDLEAGDLAVQGWPGASTYGPSQLDIRFIASRSADPPMRRKSGALSTGRPSKSLRFRSALTQLPAFAQSIP